MIYLPSVRVDDTDKKQEYTFSAFLPFKFPLSHLKTR